MQISKATDTTTSTSPAAMTGSSELGKNDFLNLLITQLQYQDPTKPMEDREFIAQLAQFSTLEQMQQFNQQVGALTQMSVTSQAVSLIGRNVEYLGDDGEKVQGQVSGVRFDGGLPVLLVGDQEVSPGMVSRVW